MSNDKMREALQALDKLVPAPSSKAHQFYKPHYDKIKTALTQQPEREPGLVEALVTCQNWFERHSPTAPLINGAHAEHPMLEMIKSALSSRPARQPGLWVRNLSDPQPRAITDLKYRSVREVDNDVQFIPMFTSPQPSAQVPDVDDLAQFIRQIDGDNEMGAGALAQSVVDWLESRQ